MVYLLLRRLKQVDHKTHLSYIRIAGHKSKNQNKMKEKKTILHVLSITLRLHIATLFIIAKTETISNVFQQMNSKRIVVDLLNGMLPRDENE